MADETDSGEDDQVEKGLAANQGQDLVAFILTRRRPLLGHYTPSSKART
jgi:hypothetical protein